MNKKNLIATLRTSLMAAAVFSAVYAQAESVPQPQTEVVAVNTTDGTDNDLRSFLDQLE